MSTPLYSTDIIPLTSRPTLTVMDDGDYFVILDTSTGKISKILRTNIQKALNISYDNTTSGLTAETVQAALDELVVNLGSIDDAVSLIDTRLDTTQLAVARHDKSINVLEKTVQGGQGATVDYTGVSPITTDARSTGRMNPTVDGLTLTNLVKNGDFSNGITGWQGVASVLSISSYGLVATGNGTDRTVQATTIYIRNYNIISGDKIFFYYRTRAKSEAVQSLLTRVIGLASATYTASSKSSPVQDEWYDLSFYNTASVTGGGFYVSLQAVYSDASSANGKAHEIEKGLWYVNLTQAFGAGNEPSETQIRDIVQKYFSGTQSLTIPARLKSISADTLQTSTLVIQDTAELRSVQDIIDTISVVDGEWKQTKKISTPVSVPSGVAVNVTNYPLAKTGGKFAVELTTGGTQIGVIGTDSTSGAGILRYEFAIPTITKLHTIGSLTATPSCTISWEGWTEDSYQTNVSSQITLPHSGAVQKVYGYDDHFVEYEVPSTGYTQVGTLLTITGAEANEVWYVQQVKDVALYPAMTVNTLNNDKVTLDTANGKYYQIGYTTTNGVPTVTATEVV